MPDYLTNSPIHSLGDGQFLLDDTDVDYNAIQQQEDANSAINGSRQTLEGGGAFGPMDFATYTSDELWLEITALTNTTGYFVVHPPEAEATNGVYDLFATTNLTANVPGLNLTNWLWLLRTDPGETNLAVPELPPDQAYFTLARTNDTDGDGISDAYESLVGHSDPATADPPPTITYQPLSQTVYIGDTVTFTVAAEGPQPLHYQWLFGGNAITDETNRSMTIVNVHFPQDGDYSVRVTSPAGLSTTSSNGTLTVEFTYFSSFVGLEGPRQDYTFKNGVTYYIYSRVELYGVTTIQGGAVIKPEWWETNTTLAIMGTMVCKTEDPNLPAFFTSCDDDTLGALIPMSTGSPQPPSDGRPFLDLSATQDTHTTINNLRIRYAHQGVALPATGRLDTWNCQFLQCHTAFVAGQDTTVALHNVLLSGCGAAVSASTNFNGIEAEHITADVTNLWVAPSPPAWIRLTNSILLGALAGPATLITNRVALNPATSVFNPVNAGNYYLADGSLKASGTTNISPRLLTEFRRKTTQPPVSLPAFFEVTGDLTLGPQVARYTGGPPDCGYYYNALDYTAAWLVNLGTISVLPGTAIGLRNDYVSPPGTCTAWGFDLREGSALTSHGTPANPNTFTDIQFVQEQYERPCLALLMPDFWPTYSASSAPSLDLRFCNLYASPIWCHVWSGYDVSLVALQTPASLVNWSMRDCSLHGGIVNLGPPDDGRVYGAPMDWFYGSCSVSWVNNLFDNVSVNLDPTYIWVDPALTNCDMSFQAYNNLFRAGRWFVLEPVPATAGNWVMKDNLFEKVEFFQETAQPLDFDNNGYWPLTASELRRIDDFAQLSPTPAGTPTHEVVLAAAPPHQPGPFGAHYLPPSTPLYHAGSRTANDASLFHYTTRPDQIKEGDEPSGHMVNIGLHYVATMGLGTSLLQDSDGDGIPDYVEDANGNGQVDYNETSPTNAMTVEGTLDSTNSVYDGIDLDGDGLTGSTERLFAANPLIPDNPLDLLSVPLPVTLSGLVQIPLNINSEVDPTTPFLLTVNGVTASTSVYKTNASWVAEWDTLQVANGAYQLGLQLELDDYSAAVGSTKLGFVQNAICFPDGFPIAGDALYLRPQTIHTNGTWALDVYDDHGNLFVSLAGVVDASGTCDYPDTSEPGISIGLLDEEGNQLPSNCYTTIVTTYAASAGGSGGSASTTNRVFVERPWTGNGLWAIAYMEVYPKDGTADLGLATMMGAEVAIVQASQYGMNSVINWPFAHSPQAFRLATTPDWYTLGGQYLRNGNVRNFVYFGHGGSDAIGGDLNHSLTSGELEIILHNAPDPLTRTNEHPYRFVFLDGCDTAKGDLCKAFGIPKTTISSTDMITKYRLTPRAFLGWKSKTAMHVKNTLPMDHQQFVLRFFQIWPTTNQATARPYTLRDALDAAAKNDQGQPWTDLNERIVIYGCPDLQFWP